MGVRSQNSSATSEELISDAEGADLAGVDRLAVTDRLAYARGRFYANQAPGTALLGVPPYFALYHAERWFGVDPDNWWALTLKLGMPVRSERM